jgi:hypothetical protein
LRVLHARDELKAIASRLSGNEAATIARRTRCFAVEPAAMLRVIRGVTASLPELRPSYRLHALDRAAAVLYYAYRSREPERWREELFMDEEEHFNPALHLIRAMSAREQVRASVAELTDKDAAFIARQLGCDTEEPATALGALAAFIRSFGEPKWRSAPRPRDVAAAVLHYIQYLPDAAAVQEHLFLSDEDLAKARDTLCGLFGDSETLDAGQD